jgi:hypothetical protein
MLQEPQAIFAREFHQNVVRLQLNGFAAEFLVRRRPNVLPVVEHLRHRHVISVEFVDLDFEKVLWIAQVLAQAR